MKNEPLATFDFDDDKKDYIKKATLTKLLNEIKTALSKHKKIRIILEKSE